MPLFEGIGCNMPLFAIGALKGQEWGMAIKISFVSMIST